MAGPDAVALAFGEARRSAEPESADSRATSPDRGPRRALPEARVGDDAFHPGIADDTPTTRRLARTASTTVVDAGTAAAEAPSPADLDPTPSVQPAHRPGQDDLAGVTGAPDLGGLDAAIPPSQRFATWSRQYIVGLAAADALIGALAAAIPASVSGTLSRSPVSVAVLALVSAMLWPAVIGMSRGYQRSRVGVGYDEPRAVFRAAVTLVVAGAFPAGLLNQHALLTLVVVAVPFALALSLAGRLGARKLLHHRQRRGENVRHIVVVGSTAAALQLRERLDREPHCGMKVVGVCVPHHEVAQADNLGAPVLGDLSEVAQVVRRIGCDAVAVTSDNATRYNYLRELSWSLEGIGVEMLVDPGLVEVAGPRMHIRPLMGFPLLHVEEPHFTGWRRVIKRGSDIVLTSLGLLLISPVMLAIAAAIKLQDGGPIIFRQARVGRGGRPFTMLKFRSMVLDAEARKAELMARNEGKGGLFKLTEDPRITPLGRFLRAFSLDELPQLFNVLNGTMSLVGPRPHLAHELAQMPSEASRRSLVTPGLTGLWQVSGRSDLEGEHAVRLDLRYVENWSLTLDLLIMWKTAYAVLAKSGAR